MQINNRLIQQVKTLLARNERLEAIKLVSRAGEYGPFFLGLRDCQAVVDAIAADNIKPTGPTYSEVSMKRIVDKSVLRRLSVQIPEDHQPAFLAQLFSTDVLLQALTLSVERKDDCG